jgi:hypothetical protein
MPVTTFFALWTLFYMGFATSLCLQAQTSVSSASNNLTSVKDWLRLHWHVVWANLFLSSAFSAAIFHMIPASSGLGEFSKYAVGGFMANGVIDKILFIFGQQIGTKVEVPQVAPPAVPATALPAIDSHNPQSPISQGGTNK